MNAEEGAPDRRTFGGSALAHVRAMASSSTRLIQILCFSIAAAMLAADASAQADLIDSAVAHVGLGAGINFYRPSSNDADSSEGVVIAYRWHAFHSGWGPTFGIDWHNTDFHQMIGGVDAPLGSLRMRALLAGFGHTKRLGRRFTTSANISAGYSFNNLTADSGVSRAFSRTGVTLVGVHTNDSAVVKPEVSLWYDVFRHVGLGVSVAYLFIRPEEVTTTPTGSTTRDLNADTWELTAGITFGVWKKKQ
jgi:hypothetical protein